MQEKAISASPPDTFPLVRSFLQAGKALYCTVGLQEIKRRRFLCSLVNPTRLDVLRQRQSGMSGQTLISGADEGKANGQSYQWEGAIVAMMATLQLYDVLEFKTGEAQVALQRSKPIQDPGKPGQPRPPGLIQSSHRRCAQLCFLHGTS